MNRFNRHSFDPQDARTDIPAVWEVKTYFWDGYSTAWNPLAQQATEDEWDESWKQYIFLTLSYALVSEGLPLIPSSVKYYHHNDEYFACSEHIVVKARFKCYQDFPDE